MKKLTVLRIDTWFDYSCPLCYLHHVVLNRLEEIYGEHIEIIYHPARTLENRELRAIGLLDEEWDRLVVPLATEVGVALKHPPVTASSDRATVLAYAAQAAGKFRAIHSAIFEAYFQRAQRIDDPEVLTRLAHRLGLSIEREFALFDEKGPPSDLEADAHIEREIGLNGVPFTLLSREPRDARTRERPVALFGSAPLRHFYVAIGRLFPEGFPLKERTRRSTNPPEAGRAQC